jgi:cell division septum initiation protein DivIVA
MAKPLTPPQIRDAELPRALRGFDVEATRAVLADAASALSAVTRERDDLRKQVDELGAQASRNPTDAEQLGAVLLTAKRAGDELIAKASEDAAAIRAEAEQTLVDAEKQRTSILVQAQARADDLVREGAATAQTLGQEAEELRHSITVHRQEFVTFLRSALNQLEHVESARPAVAETGDLDGELLAQLPSSEQ